eukprot:g2893.t1
MAAIRRGLRANYMVHDNYEMDTSDREDHTFCGIMFDVYVKDDLPVDHIQIESIWVRGALGPMSIYTTPGGIEGKHTESRQWILLYEKEHEPSYRDFAELKLDVPIQLKPGVKRGIYVHSKRFGDESLVYDNQTSEVTQEDNFVRILSGIAHLSNVPFGGRAPWGGYPWRSNRQFVGRLSYGSRYLLWQPELHDRFPNRFRECSRALLIRHATSWSGLPSSIVLYILNMIPFDWFDTEYRGRNEPLMPSSRRGYNASENSSYHFRRRNGPSGLRGMTRILSHFLGGGILEDDDDDDDEDYEEGDDEDMSEDGEDMSEEEDDDNATSTSTAAGQMLSGHQDFFLGLLRRRVEEDAAEGGGAKVAEDEEEEVVVDDSGDSR